AQGDRLRGRRSDCGHALSSRARSASRAPRAIERTARDHECCARWAAHERGCKTVCRRSGLLRPLRLRRSAVGLASESAAAVQGRRETRRGKAMNRDQVQGQFTRLQGEAKRLWGQLTDDDFKKAQGSSDKLIGIIQERFGDTKDAIKKKLNL